MATRFAYDAMEPQSYADRIYTICSFDPGLVVARVKLFDARTDSEAIETARSIDRFKVRELWERHRLVAEFKPDC
jgi:hypothetical protein